MQSIIETNNALRRALAEGHPADKLMDGWDFLQARVLPPELAKCIDASDMSMWGSMLYATILSHDNSCWGKQPVVWEAGQRGHVHQQRRAGAGAGESASHQAAQVLLRAHSSHRARACSSVCFAGKGMQCPRVPARAPGCWKRARAWLPVKLIPVRLCEGRCDSSKLHLLHTEMLLHMTTHG